MTEKDYVGMEMCFFCQEPRGIILDRGLRKTLPRQATYNTEPCPSCQKLMEAGIILISVRDGEQAKMVAEREMARAKWKREGSRGKFRHLDNPYRTGGWVVVREEAINATALGGSRVAFVEDCDWDAMGLPRGEVEGIPTKLEDVNG